MSKKITLVGLNGIAVGNAILQSDYPSVPEFIEWNGRYFKALTMPVGLPSPGNFEVYKEISLPLNIPTPSVSPPDTEPV